MTSQIRSAGLGGFIGYDLASLQFVLIAKDVPPCKWDEAVQKINLLSDVARRHSQDE